MPPESEISTAIEHLRATTALLSPATECCDLDYLETALAARQLAVERVDRLIARYPKKFTSADLEDIRISHSKGKRALERLLELRGRGWSTATQLSQTAYVLRSFAPVDSNRREG